MFLPETFRIVIETKASRNNYYIMQPNGIPVKKKNAIAKKNYLENNLEITGIKGK
jgi:hypothetical protein